MSRLSTIAICLLLALSLAGCANGGTAAHGSSKSSSSPSSSEIKNSYGITNATADTVFGFPEQVSYRGGTIGVFKASSGDCTVENITTWYNQYVKFGIDAWDVVIYTDKPGYGIYAGGGMVEVNTALDSNYMTLSSDDSTMYVFKEGESLQDGELALIG